MCSASHAPGATTMTQPTRHALSFIRFAAAFACLVLALFCAPGAHADVGYVTSAQARQKVSTDLIAALTAPSVSGMSWAKETSSGRLVKVLVLAKPTVDSDLEDLRRAIVNANGSVYYRYISVGGVAALLPASRVLDIARRTDVESISPNRVTARTKSLVQTVTGVGEVPKSASLGTVDGTGIGIAFLDSGIMSSHGAFRGPNGSRVKRSVDMGNLVPS